MINITKKEMVSIAMSAGLDPDVALTTVWRGIPKRHMPAITLLHDIQLIELGWALANNLSGPVAFEVMGGIIVTRYDEDRPTVTFSNVEIV